MTDVSGAADLSARPCPINLWCDCLTLPLRRDLSSQDHISNHQRQTHSAGILEVDFVCLRVFMHVYV